jgi:uncharacterized protein (DUF1015 family)
LRLAPFHGVRYAPGKVSGIANVTSPPYDVIGTGIREHLLSADPHNVIRLILPDADPSAGDDPPGEAAARLGQWLADGVLTRDAAPALYVYEQVAGSVLQRGLIALVGVGSPADSGILPHEDVMPGPVAGRRELMAATRANLEPIFLVYDGEASVASLIDRIATEREPLLSAAVDGTGHRLWVVSDPAEVSFVTSALAGRRALIADGHHRYAAYRQLRSAHGPGAGPWDYGLAFLVDSAAYPPRIGAVHRVLPCLEQDSAVSLARGAFQVRPAGAGLPDALRSLQDAGRSSTAFLLAGPSGFQLLSHPDPASLAAAMPAGRSPRWRSLDAAVMQELLIGRMWGIKDNERDVQVFHDASDAVRATATSGTAVLANPISFGVVREIAEHGERVPRKSTSFGPKPLTGLVLRVFALLRLFRGRRRARGERLVNRVVDVEHLAQPGNAEDPQNPPLGAHQVDASVVRPDPFEPADEHAQARGVEKLHAFHVDDQPVTTRVDQRDYLLPKPRRGVDIYLAAHLDDRRVPGGVFIQHEIHRIIPSPMSGTIVRWVMTWLRDRATLLILGPTCSRSIRVWPGTRGSPPGTSSAATGPASWRQGPRLPRRSCGMLSRRSASDRATWRLSW